MDHPFVGLPSSLGSENTFDTYGLDFKYVAAQLASACTSNTQHGTSEQDDDTIQFPHLNVFPFPSTAGNPPEDSSPSNGGQLIYLSGYPSPERMLQLTQSHRIDPEFWRRHFSQIKHSTTSFEDTKVPSSTCNIIQLRYWTIGSRGGSVSSSNISSSLLRKQEKALMEIYKDGLSSSVSPGILWKTGDSIVRRYEVHDQQYFSVEQVLSIYLTRTSNYNQNSKQWFALLFSDCGKDLWQSPKGPWLGSHLPGKADYYTRFLPVPEHQSWTRSISLAGQPSFPQRHSKHTLRELPQTFARLPQTFNNFKDVEASSQSPFYALSGIFGFFVSSEAQVLSFLAAQIEENSSKAQLSSEVADTDSLSNLLHCQQLLEGHIEELQYVLNVVSNGCLMSSPNATDDVTANTAASLQLDLDHLLKRAHSLKSRTETYISLAMNVASINEARRGVKHNQALFRFTVLASVYVPLSYTASVFGMNFKQFGQGELSIWVYFAASAPIFAISAFFLFFRLESLKKVLSKGRK